MTPEQALLRLGASTAGAIREVLESHAPGGVVPGPVGAVPAGEDPLTDADLPGVVATVVYEDGVTGGNLVILGLEGARRLAAAMQGTSTEVAATGEDLSPKELTAVTDAMRQMMGAAARTTGKVLGEDVRGSDPHIRAVATPEEALQDIEHAGQAVTVSFTLLGAPCLLVQLVPHSFVVRMTRAMDELAAEFESAPLSESLRTVNVRVWAELGRTRMASARAATLPGGAVIDLDREVEEPIDLYADGMRFATGRLLVTDDGGLAVRIEGLVNGPATLVQASLDA